ncbi:MAG TPA: hypothetical protein VGB87_05815 [Vicinamibacteria bacterium]
MLQGSVVVTHAIDGASGRLQESVAQRVGEAFALVGEPQGRFVFAAHDGPYSPPRDGSVVAYAPDPSTGSLTTLSEAPVTHGMEWYWLSASSTRVYGMMFRYTGHTYPRLVSFAVGGDGRLGPGSARDFERDWDPWVALDADASPDVFYNSTPTGGLAAHFVEPDGSLKQMGGSHLCFATGIDHPRPLAAARGFLFASALLSAASRETVCSWEGPRLAPRANLGLQAHRAVALVARDDASSPTATASATTLVAMVLGSPASVNHSVRLFAMGGDGDLAPLDTVTGPWRVRQLAFHPSGRFLYVSHAPYDAESLVGLSVYSIDSQGRLALVQTLEDGGGAMAVTLARVPWPHTSGVRDALARP